MTDETKRAKRPRDTNQLAKFIVDVATGEAEDEALDDHKDKAAQAMGRKGGASRARKLDAQRRSEIARRAALHRWAAKSED